MLAQVEDALAILSVIVWRPTWRVAAVRSIDIMVGSVWMANLLGSKE